MLAKWPAAMPADRALAEARGEFTDPDERNIAEWLRSMDVPVQHVPKNIPDVSHPDGVIPPGSPLGRDG